MTNNNSEALSASVRIDERVNRLVSRIEPGEIAVLDQPDLDRNAALSLISRRPAAVLNAASSVTGRHPNIGAYMLVEAGITLVDDLGSDLMTLTEGETIEVIEGNIFAKGTLIAAGRKRDLTELSSMRSGADSRIGLGVSAFANAATLTWQRESTLFLGSERMPHIQRPKKATTALIVSPDDNLAKNLKALRAFCRDFTPVIIAVDSAADDMKALKRRPTVLIGDVSSVSEKRLRGAKQIVLIESSDGTTPGRERVVGYARDFQVLQTSAGATDAAILLADVSGFDQIVTVGKPQNLTTFFDLSGAEQTSDFFIRTRATEKLVSGQVVGKLYRPGISNFSLLWLVIAALLVIAAALWLTPWGQSIWSPWSIWGEAMNTGFRSEAFWPQLVV